MGVCGQVHASTALTQKEMSPVTHLTERRIGYSRSGSGGKKQFRPFELHVHVFLIKLFWTNLYVYSQTFEHNCKRWFRL
jgi:hypothetical protein